MKEYALRSDAAIELLRELDGLLLEQTTSPPRR